ncbi:MAG TPA: HD domain-containing phosphohydrolase [Candidatus Eisenbacteria bacterium]|nr:HD domain-containing phosphohydrolase [Candidatus Eisenbacteria bacterium]
MKPASRHAAPDVLHLSDVLAALSFALDLAEGQPMGHALRSGLIAQWIAERFDLPMRARRDLYFAALVKDAGCSSNAARVYQLFGGDDQVTKATLRRADTSSLARAALAMFSATLPGAPWVARARRIAEMARAGPREAVRLVELRCDRGAEIAAGLGLGDDVARAVRALEEHWDGRGQPHGLRGEDIPLLARVLSLARTLEMYAVRDGVDAALELVARRSGRWFDPRLVAACAGIERPLAGWCALDTRGLRAAISEAEPGGAALLAGPPGVDRVAHHFSLVVDAKSPFTAAHSQRVADLAARVAGEFGWDEREVRSLRRAALLHDLGKLSVPNTILDKPGPLTPEEWRVMRRHAHYTEAILDHIAGFEGFAFEAASHHERLDGRGYCRGIAGDDVPPVARVLAVADVYDALRSSRPYRGALEPEQVFAIMERHHAGSFDSECLEALRGVVEGGGAGERAAA